MQHILLAIGTAILFTYFSMPAIIRTAREKQLYDLPGERSSHFLATPSLGGVGIFGGILISMLLWLPFGSERQLQYLAAALLFIFLIGIKDDISPIAARKKLAAQFVTAAIIVVAGDIRISSLHGFLSFSGDLPYWLSLAVSVFTVLVIINAFNLIDGINGLSAGIGILLSGVLGIWFYLTGQASFAVLSAITAAAYLAFLPYNLSTPTRTFMGDSGSLVLGTIAATLVLQFIESCALLPAHSFCKLAAVPTVAMTIVLIPLFDTLRVFATRIFRGHSPFLPDRRHIHHLLIDYGFTHLQASSALIGFNALMIAFVAVGQAYIEQHLLLLLVLGATAAFTFYFHRTVNKQRVQRQAPPRLNGRRPGPPSVPVTRKLSRTGNDH